MSHQNRSQYFVYVRILFGNYIVYIQVTHHELSFLKPICAMNAGLTSAKFAIKSPPTPKMFPFIEDQLFCASLSGMYSCA